MNPIVVGFAVGLITSRMIQSPSAVRRFPGGVVRAQSWPNEPMPRSLQHAITRYRARLGLTSPPIQGILTPDWCEVWVDYYQSTGRQPAPPQYCYPASIGPRR